MARKRTRRTRSPHPGVVIFTRQGSGHWRARWTDPDTGRYEFIRLDGPELGLTNEAARIEWAKEKSKSVQRRRAEIESGAPRLTQTAVAAACKTILDAVEEQREPGTAYAYRKALRGLEDFAARNGVRFIEELDPAHLARYRLKLVARKLKVPRRGKGAGRGGHRTSTRKISVATINTDLRSLASALNRMRKLGLTPKLSRDSIAESLAREAQPRREIHPLRQEELRALLRAALRHDGARWEMTREEHDGLRPKGSTPRFDPIAPFVATVLLTGARVGEMKSLEWAEVDLDALGDDGLPAGEIRLPPEKTKTDIGRTVTLEVSPRLRALLKALRVQAGGARFVFGGEAPLANHAATNAKRRLLTEFAAPERFTWQTLRQTAGSFLTNARGIFGGASAYCSAKQLGHSVAVAERHYLGTIKGIPREARTLDAAMCIEAELDALLACVGRTASPVALPEPRAVRSA